MCLKSLGCYISHNARKLSGYPKAKTEGFQTEEKHEKDGQVILLCNDHQRASEVTSVTIYCVDDDFKFKDLTDLHNVSSKLIHT